MKILLVVMSVISMAVPSLACVPSVTKDIIVKVMYPGIREAVLEQGGNEFLYSEVLIYLPIGDEESIVDITYDESILHEETKLGVLEDLGMRPLQFAPTLKGGETEVQITVRDSMTAQTRTFKQKVRVVHYPTPRGC